MRARLNWPGVRRASSWREARRSVSKAEFCRSVQRSELGGNGNRKEIAAMDIRRPEIIMRISRLIGTNRLQLLVISVGYLMSQAARAAHDPQNRKRCTERCARLDFRAEWATAAVVITGSSSVKLAAVWGLQS
jgi:hypothetical protein